MDRNTGVDVVRLAGAAAIVAGHLWASLAPWLYSWHVLVFFFLTGWLWSPVRSIRDETRRRARTLLVPYLGWFLPTLALFIGVYLYLDGAIRSSDVIRALWGGAAATRPFTTFWFFTALFVATVAWRLAQGLPRPFVAVIALGSLALLSIAGPALSKAPLDAGVGLGCLGLVAAGQVLRRVALGWRAGLVLVLLGVTTSGLGLVEPMTLKNGDVGTPVLSLATGLAVSWGLVVVATRWVPHSATISSVTALIPAIILFHPVALWLVAAPPDSGPMDAVTVLVLTAAVVLVAARGPWRPLLLGPDRRPAPAALR